MFYYIEIKLKIKVTYQYHLLPRYFYCQYIKLAYTLVKLGLDASFLCLCLDWVDGVFEATHYPKQLTNKCPWELFSISAQTSFGQDPTLVWQDVNYQLETKHLCGPAIEKLIIITVSV